MNIDNLTIAEAKQIATIFSGAATSTAPVTAGADNGLSAMIGKKCIIRTYSAGVWFGVVEQKAGAEVIVREARRLWRWKTREGISLSAVAVTGVDESGCQFAPAVDQVWLEAIELIPCTREAIKYIEAVQDAEIS